MPQISVKALFLKLYAKSMQLHWQYFINVSPDTTIYILNNFHDNFLILHC